MADKILMIRPPKTELKNTTESTSTWSPQKSRVFYKKYLN